MNAISGSFGALQDGIPQDIFIVLRIPQLEIFFVHVPSALSHGTILPANPLNPGVDSGESHTDPDTGSKLSKAECAAHSGLQPGPSCIDMCGEAHMHFVDTHTP